MPVLHAKTHDMGRARGDLAHIAIINSLARPLVCASQKCIRCATNANLLRISRFLQGHAIFK